MDEHAFISEIRHSSTHKAIPNLKLTETAIKYFLCFIYYKYWLKLI